MEEAPNHESNVATISVSDIRVSESMTTKHDQGVTNQGYASLDEEKVIGKKKKVPRRILHFSDGILEEYSTDEEDDPPPPAPIVDPKKLTWLPWVWHYLTKFGGKSLNIADNCGEKLAWFFGITSPKYQFAIDEYNRVKREEEEERLREKREKEAQLKREFSKIATMESCYDGPQSTEEPDQIKDEISFKTVEQEIFESVSKVKLVDPEAKLSQKEQKQPEPTKPQEPGNTGSPVGGL